MPRKKAAQPKAHKYTLSLTKAERDEIVNHSRLRGLARKSIQAAEGEVAAVELTEKQADDLYRIVEEPILVGMRLVNRLDNVREKLIEALDIKLPERLPPPANDPELVYQFRVEILNTEPLVWRSIQVRDCGLDTLHYYIQAAFGWEDAHLHEFNIGRVRFGPMHDDLGFDLEYEDEAAVKISQFRPDADNRVPWLYTYDSGDDWRHRLAFEEQPPFDPKMKYPVCVGGERACPPEDCGGPYGYADLLDALEHPRQAKNAEQLEWLGPFDPAKFDAAKASKAMRKFG